jgi:hypothetical protein
MAQNHSLSASWRGLALIHLFLGFWPTFNYYLIIIHLSGLCSGRGTWR